MALVGCELSSEVSNECYGHTNGDENKINGWNLGLPSLWSAGNWAVGVFAITSLAAYEFCRKRQRDELAGMKQAFEMMQDLKIKQQKDKEKAAAAVTARAEEEKRQKSWTNMSNYKFW